VVLGNVLVPIAAEAVHGDSYTTCVTYASASLELETVCVEPGPCATLTIPQTWFEDDHPAITYTGSSDWHEYAHPAASAGHLKFSTQTGAVAEFTFHGTGLRWMLAGGPIAGRARVYLDGAYLATVDLYRPGLALLTLEKTGLALDTYTVAIEVAGTKHPLSTGYYVDIDAFEVVR
nr:hypothetical protein [Gemmatimonadales bacterium]NIN12414.1 hypothetical protein [Gemmatimonadales bacterium]NIN50945.1 hypothetical protein [Gemmatimonadales bacterium]NIP08409.1 hypothetical protein [Gemmatimonadales bacterium]NIR03597.1 hypothetical protein [Gemmatimonadales bacterium]